ncbi:uncharacterized protein LDX57_001319 [Aspergillus melleus]|uniref:uncharacterized protein n=1 Tax=Aspergillus melleus TaxID=138277 RepID=UPI001E8D349D|nr:uncharacterized protein LDX57_001319 [Aspergillus melleus]KAH8423559.1 hypothetical protein LDX57_001319 [Aspergillus melleus]
MDHEPTTMTPEDQAREQELNTSLSESLTCQTCTIRIPRATYHRHLESQIYVATRNPPFRLSRAEVNGLRAFGLSSPDTTPTPSAEENIENEIDTKTQLSPHTTLSPEDIPDDEDENTPIAPHARPPPRRRPGYQSLMTTTQRAAYEAQIQRYVADVPGKDVAMARYHVDYHVHLHWLSRRGALTLCRDVKEMHELRKWRWKMAQMDVQAASMQGEGSGCSGDEGNEDRKRKRKHVTVRRWGWPGDSHLFMMYQTALWRQKWLVRQKHLDEVRVKWAAIMAERQRQRKCVRVKLFWGNGYKNLLREIELEEPWFGEHIIR